MKEDTFVFLDEFSDTELYIFLNRCREKILKFIWKEQKIEIIGKYLEQLESCYNTELKLEVPFELLEIGYDSVVYKVLSKVEEEDLEWGEFGDWDAGISIEISIYNYPDEVRNLDNEVIWTKENIRKEHIDIINQKNKRLEELKIRGREYFKYLDEWEILRREKAGQQYAEYKRSLKEYINYMKKYLKNNEYSYWFIL